MRTDDIEVLDDAGGRLALHAQLLMHFKHHKVGVGEVEGGELEPQPHRDAVEAVTSRPALTGTLTPWQLVHCDSIPGD